MELLHLVSDFVRDVSHHVEGTTEEDGLLQTIRPALDRFKLAIRYTAPDFRVHERKARQQVRFTASALLKGSDDAGNDKSGASESESPDTIPHPDFLINEDQYDFRPTNDDNAIYIDEVMQRAQQ